MGPRFSIEKKIGEGGFSVVYKAVYRETKELCGLKIFKTPIDSMSPSNLEGYLKEVGIL
jgi:serine/threonine protein kinase